MTIDELMKMWEEDAPIDQTNLGEESIRIPKLHSKYYNIFIHEKLLLRKYELDYKDLYRVKHEYYNGILSEEELKQYGYQPFAMRILKADLPIYLDADKELQNVQKKISIQKEKIDFAESIVKSLVNRGFSIRASIDYMKFMNGG